LTATFIVSASAASADVADSNWQADTTAWHWGRDRQVDMINTAIDVRLDPSVVHVDGAVTLTFAAIAPGVQQLKLDAERLSIDAVTDARGHALDFSADDHGLTVNFPVPLRSNDTTSIRVAYHGTPELGLYFIPSVPQDPDKVPMIWSQGQPEENRYWFPGYDYPNDRATSSVTVRTPRPNIVVSNGRMVKQEENSDGTRTFHWACDVPNPNYLIAVAVGQFDSLVQSTSDSLRVVYYCHKGWGDRLGVSMSETPGMIEYFERMIGVRFPYAQYAQVMVSDFVAGGMENAGMTINTESTLHSARTHGFYGDNTDGLIAHELAHQWFGDLVTYNDWAHVWLGEGFATYFADLWVEGRWGHDRFELSMDGTRSGGIGAARQTRRSTVHHQYADPDDMYDGYAYSRAATVLHMIRGLVGDSLWWATIHRYVVDNYAKSAVTEDFKRALETTTGRDFDWFFNQWIDHGGHPELSVETSYDPDTKMLTVEIEQTQKLDAVTSLFQFPLDVEWVSGAERSRGTFEVKDQKSTFYIPAADKPDYVLIDPEGWLLADITFNPSVSSLVAQSRDSVRVLGRLRAVRALGKRGSSDDVLGDLSWVLRHDPQPSIRAAAADALGDLGGTSARDSLFAGLSDPDPDTRNRVIYALGGFEDDDQAYARLAPIAKSDEMEPLRGSAIDAASMIDPDRAAPLAKTAIGRRSEKYTVESDAFTALRRTHNADLIPIALPYTRPGNPTSVRSAALGLIASLAKYEKDVKTRDRYSLEIERYLGDRNGHLRHPAMRAIGALGREGAVDALERVEQQSPDRSDQETARDAIKAIREHKPEEMPNQVSRQLDEEKDARKKLEDRLDELEKRLDSYLEGKGNAKSESPPK
jgi:aminopeptidase N